MAIVALVSNPILERTTEFFAGFEISAWAASIVSLDRPRSVGYQRVDMAVAGGKGGEFDSAACRKVVYKVTPGLGIKPPL